MKRHRIFERDEFRCVYCGSVFPPEELTLDHVQARVRGGDRSDGNLVTACGGCNVKKGHRRLSEFLSDDGAARENFFRHAVHVWDRHMRTLREAMERPPGRRIPDDG
ncbi:MAG TPA: HNH endonuclease [Gemmatimonadaceae bacterium]|nr:HNH endonuclease [Gemmatimonadaceae bacterium]